VLALTEQEQEAIRALAAPLQPLERDIFVAHVAEALASYPPEMRGAGLAHRLAAAMQRDFLKTVGVRWKPKRDHGSTVRP
jgi:hypothetical protein